MMKSKRLSRRMIIPSDDDWYQTAVKTHRTEKDRWDLWKPSEEWLPRVHAGVWSPEVAVRLIRSLRVLADMLGVPPQTEFELAACANIGTAAAGFHDVPHFLRPYILFDAGVGRLVDSAHICDVYCGLAIHEAAHILYTRHYYRIASTVGPFKQRLMNILEDDRIESKLKSHFGVAAGYLHILKRELLEKSSIHANLDAPEQHAPLNSIATFILTFVRAPWMISGNSAHWVAPNDNQPALLRLRDILRSPSATENDVEEQANALLDWLNKLGWQTKELDAAATPGMHDDGEKSVASGDQQRNQKRRGGNQSVGSAKKTAAHERTKDELKDSVLEKRFLFGEVKDGFDEQFRLEVRRLLLSHSESKPRPYRNAELVKGVRLNHVDASIQASSTYDRIKRIHSSEIQRLRMLASELTSPRFSWEPRQPRGRLSSRDIVEVHLSGKCFRRIQEEQQYAAQITLLLDASGSMAGTRAEQAKATAVLMAEAFRSVPQINCRIVSHNASQTHVSINNLFGSDQPDPRGILAYDPCNWNFDSVAIEWCGSQMRVPNDSGCRRILVVISDGLPCGRPTAQGTPVELAANAVRELRHQGILVICFNVAQENNIAIFGQRHTVQLDCISDLPRRFAALLRRHLQQ